MACTESARIAIKGLCWLGAPSVADTRGGEGLGSWFGNFALAFCPAGFTAGRGFGGGRRKKNQLRQGWAGRRELRCQPQTPCAKGLFSPFSPLNSRTPLSLHEGSTSQLLKAPQCHRRTGTPACARPRAPVRMVPGGDGPGGSSSPRRRLHGRGSTARSQPLQEKPRNAASVPRGDLGNGKRDAGGAGGCKPWCFAGRARSRAGPAAVELQVPTLSSLPRGGHKAPHAPRYPPPHCRHGVLVTPEEPRSSANYTGGHPATLGTGQRIRLQPEGERPGQKNPGGQSGTSPRSP